MWFSVIARGGAALDPIGQEGRCRHVFSLARRGAGKRNRAQLDDDIDFLGASLEPVISQDWAGFSGICLSSKFDELSRMSADVVCSPTFEFDEYKKLVDDTRHALDEIRDDDGSLAHRFFRRFVAPGHPYARTTLGTEDSLEQFDFASFPAFFAERMAQENLVFGFAGNITEQQALAHANHLVAALPTKLDSTPPDLVWPKVSDSGLLLVDKPDRNQSQVIAPAKCL